MLEPDKWSSRKLAITIGVMLAAMWMPLLYAKAGVADSVTLAMLGIIGACSGIYNFTNVMAKKYEPEKKEPELMDLDK
jgi:hypothetical protein